MGACLGQCAPHAFFGTTALYTGNIIFSQPVGDVLIFYPQTHRELEATRAHVIQQGIYYAAAPRQFGQSFIGAESRGAPSRQNKNTDVDQTADLRRN